MTVQVQLGDCVNEKLSPAVASSGARQSRSARLLGDPREQRTKIQMVMQSKSISQKTKLPGKLPFNFYSLGIELNNYQIRSGANSGLSNFDKVSLCNGWPEEMERLFTKH